MNKNQRMMLYLQLTVVAMLVLMILIVGSGL